MMDTIQCFVVFKGKQYFKYSLGDICELADTKLNNIVTK